MVATYLASFVHYIIMASLLFTFGQSEILKLENATLIHCIDDDNDSTIYTLPPLGKFQSNPNLLKNVRWNNNDWTLKSSTDMAIAAVTDKRWEDFTPIKTHYHRFKNCSSISVSVLSPARVELIAYDGRAGTFLTTKVNGENQWHHFSVILKGNVVYFYKNYNIIKKATNSKITQFFFKSEKPTYWKIHKYNFEWSNKVSEDTPSTIIIPPSGKSCLSLYTSLCKTCSLEVISNNGSKTITSKVKQDTEITFWQTDQLKINPIENTSIAFYRRNSGSSDGYWTLNFDFCDSHSSASFRKNESENFNHSCNSLKQAQHSDKKTISAFTCSPGNFGKECQYSCEKILGNEYSFCQNHYMCDKTMCLCAWGTQGTTCQNDCKDGTWGFGCRGRCGKDCTTCSKINGTCFDKAPTTRYADHLKMTTEIGKNVSMEGATYISATTDIVKDVSVTKIDKDVSVEGTAFISATTDIAKDVSVTKIDNDVSVESTTWASETMSQSSLSFNVVLIIMLIIFIIVLITIAAIFIAIYIKKKFSSLRSENDLNTKKEIIPLQSISLERDLTKDIDKEDFINILSQKLLEDSLESEFLKFPHHTKESWQGQRSHNTIKNKKIDGRKCIPYDYNRVILKEMEGLGSDDYINASYINGFDKPRAYIACPGPKFNTIKDFWRMIWQENVKLIVMATDFVENGKICRECVLNIGPKNSKLYMSVAIST